MIVATRAPGHLLVEERQPPAGHDQLQPVDARRGDERDRNEDRATAELQADPRAHRSPAEGHRPARRLVARGDDPGQPGARLLEVDLAAQHVADQVVDQREVLVVDVALLDVPQQHRRGLLGIALVAHRQRGERDVDLRVAHAEVPRERPHGRDHVRRAGPRGQQQLADPQTEVQGEVQLALGHGRHVPSPAGRQST